MRESSLFGNRNLCLDLDFLVDNCSKAKLIERMSFSNNQDFKEQATHLWEPPFLPGKSNSLLLFGIILLPFSYSLRPKHIPVHWLGSKPQGVP